MLNLGSGHTGFTVSREKDLAEIKNLTEGMEIKSRRSSKIQSERKQKENMRRLKQRTNIRSPKLSWKESPQKGENGKMKHIFKKRVDNRQKYSDWMTPV